jgi:vitamin B12 transporter
VNVANPTERVQVPGYAVLSLLARFNYTRNLFIAARLENALDKEYQLVHGFNTPPRGLFVTVGWQP